MQTVLRLLGPDYHMIQLFVDPSDAGHTGVSRQRTYVFFYNHRKVEYCHDLFDLYALVSSRIQEAVSTCPKDYLIQSPFARTLDEMNIARKRQKTHQDEA